MQPTIAFRADASTQIGSGHVKRCQSLAMALLRRGAAVSFVTRAGDVPAADLPGQQGFKLVDLPQAAGKAASMLPPGAPPHAHWLTTDWRTDAADTVAALAGSQVAVMVVDHYALDSAWHTAVAEAMGCRMVAIDDLADRSMAVDLLIDHNHADDHRRKYRSVNLRQAPILGGPLYAMLAEAFENAPRNPASDPVRSVGIFMGGIDRLNLSASALVGLRSTAGFNGPVEIVTTRSNPHLAELQAAAAADGALTLTLDAPDLAGFFGRHELHIGAGGGATWERCCLGAPTIAVIVAENQRHVLRPLATMHVLDLVEEESPGAEVLGRHALALMQQAMRRAELSAQAMGLVDGRGCARISEHILSLCPQ